MNVDQELKAALVSIGTEVARRAIVESLMEKSKSLRDEAKALSDRAAEVKRTARSITLDRNVSVGLLLHYALSLDGVAERIGLDAQKVLTDAKFERLLDDVKASTH